MTAKRWFKGNLHAHTNETDGDSPPDHVAEWYQAHGYDFLVLSDHNHLTILNGSEETKSRWPLLIGGEEITTAFEERPVHINAIGIDKVIEPAQGNSVAETIQANIDVVRAAGGLASINHPNYKWAFGDSELVQVRDAWALEIFNGNGQAHNHGGGGHPGAEAIWDRMLSSGIRVFGVATDDSHHFQGEFGPRRSNPGRGWVMVRARDLSRESMMRAMAGGDFYSSTGVKLADIHRKGRELVIEIEQDRLAKYTTVFTGPNARELWTAHGTSVRYTLSRLDEYVRATIYSSDGECAWVQPLFGED